MKRLACIAVIASLLTPGAVFASAKKLLDIETWKTKNGVPVYLIEAHSLPMLDLDVVFAAGSQYDGLQYGLANYTTSMLSEGTKAKNADQIAATFDANGGQFAASTNRDFSVVGLRSLIKDQYWKNNFAMYLDVLSNPIFEPSDIDRVKKQLLTAIKLREQNPSKVAADLFFKTLYKNSPYAHPVSGTVDSVQRINRKAMLRFYQTHFVAKNAVITMVGDVSKAQASDIAETISQRLKLGKHATRQLTVVDKSPGTQTWQEFKAQQSTVLLGQLGITPDYKQKAALNVGNFILGNPGLVSELAIALREKRGWVYGVSSQFSPLQLKGPFVISLQTKASQTQPALQLARDILLKNVSQGPSAEQVAFAKRSIIGSFPIAMSSNSQLSGFLTGIAFYHLPLDYYDKYLAQLKVVTPAQVKKAWQQVIHPKQLITVVVGPKDHRGDSE